MGELIAVNEGIDTAGAIVWWTLSGDVGADALETRWAAAGFDVDDLPNPPTARRALRRAVDSVAGRMPGDFLARPLKDGWAIVREDVVTDQNGGEQDLEYGTVATWRITDDGVRYRYVDRDLGEKLDVVQRVGEWFRHYGAVLTARDVSGWLTRTILSRFDGVPIRESGGVYFLPHETVDAWRRATEAITEAAGHTFYEVPALRSDQAVEAIVAAVTREAEEAAATLEADVAEGTLGPRAIEGRARRLEAVRGKVRRYEQTLGVALAGVTERIAHVEAAITEATLAGGGAE